jgi:hypothetical protein
MIELLAGIRLLNSGRGTSFAAAAKEFVKRKKFPNYKLHQSSGR